MTGKSNISHIDFTIRSWGLEIEGDASVRTQQLSSKWMTFVLISAWKGIPSASNIEGLAAI